MAKQVIKSWYDGSILYECEAKSIKEALERAVAAKTNLSGSDLSDSDLSGLNLRYSNLSESNLRGSNLRGSNLSGSDLSGSDLRDSNLSGSDLSGSDLSGSDLRGSNLSYSNLSYSDLRGSNLSGSDLSGSNLSESRLNPIRDDLWSVLCASPREVFALRTAIVEGRINGSAYEGKCACLVGTIANARQCGFASIPGLMPDSSRPAEVFFLAIKPGDTPEKSQFAALAVKWIDEWHANLIGAFDWQAWTEPLTPAATK